MTPLPPLTPQPRASHMKTDWWKNAVHRASFPGPQPAFHRLWILLPVNEPKLSSSVLHHEVNIGPNTLPLTVSNEMQPLYVITKGCVAITV